MSSAPEKAVSTRKRRRASRRKRRAAEAEVPDVSAVVDHRRRMNAIGEALTALSVGAEPAESDLWGRGIYLKLVGRLYDLLDSDDLTLGELEAMSKMIYDQRRAQSQALEVHRRLQGSAAAGDNGDGGSDPSPTGPLSPRLGHVVQQLYGVSTDAEPEAQSDT
ncbi:MAG: hypothetical protein GY842_11745 [bacterium]|nr:hypothetical protein [bacterium]